MEVAAVMAVEAVVAAATASLSAVHGDGDRLRKRARACVCVCVCVTDCEPVTAVPWESRVEGRDRATRRKGFIFV
jgi:hypothetical protein